VSDELDWRQLTQILRSHRSPCAVTIGTFDGVHAGHRSLIAATRRLAAERSLTAVAVTFSPRPDQYFSRGPMLPDLCSLGERISRLEAAGADRVVVLPFGRALANTSAATFARGLVDELGLRLLCVGEDFAFGRDREGTPEHIRTLGVTVCVHRFVHDESGTKISSRRLREDAAGRGKGRSSNTFLSPVSPYDRSES
jgi:riboflavin kinase/FMN adenylyltransferase